MNKLLFLIILLSVDFLTQNADAGQLQSHASLYAAARQFINTALTEDSEHEITFTTLDPRLALSACNQPLEAFTGAQPIKPGRNAVGIKCNSSKPWSLYVLAYVKHFEQVVTLTQPVKRGEVLTPQHVSLSKVDTSTLHSAFIQDINWVVHQQATHNISSGTVLSERDITRAILVKRGGRVIISSANPNLSIQMQGIALMDGAAGQSIRIKNTSSGRIISAVVTKQGVVSVGL